MSDWTAFGRVDADGTVYVKTAEGERVVGSWQAGPRRKGWPTSPGVSPTW